MGLILDNLTNNPALTEGVNRYPNKLMKSKA